MKQLTKSSDVFMVLLMCWCSSILFLSSAEAQYTAIDPDTKFQGGKVISLKKMVAHGDKLTTVPVKPGTTVIWLNDTSRVIEVEFIEKQVTLACGAPVGFFVNEEGSFSSHKIIPKAVASLCFVERGEYLFALVHRPPRGTEPLQGKTFKGKIVVQ
jgi:hypothetical protein